MRARHTAVLLLIVALGVALLAGACGGGGDSDGSNGPGVTPEATLPPSGVPELDTIAAAIRAHDIDELTPLIRLTTFDCTTQPGLPPPPQCPEGVADGSPVERFPSSTCETAMLEEKDLPNLAEAIATSRFYAAYHAKIAFYGEQYTIVLINGSGANAAGSNLGVADGTIVSRSIPCAGLSLPEYLQALDLGDAIIPPQ